MASEPIAALLAANADLRPLSERLLQIKRLQKRYRTIAPESLAAASRVCAIDGTTVVICAGSGPVAAALRHLAPRLLEGLRETRRNSKHATDQDFTSIRIHVQVDRPAPRRPVRARGEVPREKLGRLADRLGDSPLKERLREIAAGDQMKRSTRSKR